MTEFPMSGVGSSDCVHPSDCAWLQTVKSRIEYIEKWPNFCRHCDGYGYYVDSFTVDESGYHLDQYWPCEYCLGKAICPRCGRFHMGHESGQYFVCPNCGWDESAQFDGLPEFPGICICDDYDHGPCPYCCDNICR
jgi:hypothetical protein